MKKKVVIIEDDVQLNIVISEFFKIKGYEVTSIYDGMDAIDKIDEFCISDISLYVIDINLPTYNGIDILKYVRGKNQSVPIIIITASLEIENFTDAFAFGCNEYIKKPFHIKELEIRINNLFKTASNIISFSDDFYYDKESEYFFYKDNKIIFRNKEKRFTDILIQNKNKIVPLDVIYEYVWEEEDKESYPIRQLLADVRKKLPLDIIKTIIKQGYTIEVKNEI